MGCFGILLSQNGKLSRFLSIWLGTSTILHSPSSPPFKHVLFCWKLLLPLAISPTPPGYNLLVSPFSYIFDFFFPSSLAFFAVTLLLLGKAPWHVPRVFLNSASPHVIVSFLSLFFHLQIQKSISTNYPVHLQGFRAAVLKGKLRRSSDFKRGSYSVGSIWTENIAVTYYSLKWMVPQVNSWITQTLHDIFHFQPGKCLLWLLWKKPNGISKSKGRLLISLSSLLANKALEKYKGLCSQSGIFK